MDIQVITDLASSWGLLLIPLVIALTAIVKNFIPKEKSDLWSPVISLALGLSSGLFTIGIDKNGAVAGIIIGLTASGLYSSSKSIANAPKK